MAKTSNEDARDCAIEVIRNYVSKLDARAEHAKTIDARHEERMNHRLDQLHRYCDTFTDWINDEKVRIKAYCKDAIDTWKAERPKNVWGKLDLLEMEVSRLAAENTWNHEARRLLLEGKSRLSTIESAGHPA